MEGFSVVTILKTVLELFLKFGALPLAAYLLGKSQGKKELRLDIAREAAEIYKKQLDEAANAAKTTNDVVKHIRDSGAF